MLSFARLFQNETVTKILYCNKFAIHNTIDIVEVIGSSPTNPTKTKSLKRKRFKDFSFSVKMHSLLDFSQKCKAGAKSFKFVLCLMPDIQTFFWSLYYHFWCIGGTIYPASHKDLIARSMPARCFITPSCRDGAYTV